MEDGKFLLEIAFDLIVLPLEVKNFIFLFLWPIQLRPLATEPSTRKQLIFFRAKMKSKNFLKIDFSYKSLLHRFSMSTFHIVKVSFQLTTKNSETKNDFSSKKLSVSVEYLQQSKMLMKKIKLRRHR